MELFLASNFAITIITLLYNRYSQASISAKLTLSTFSLLCWVVPFTLIRDYLPQDVAVSIHWILPTTTNINAVTIEAVQPTIFSQITLTHVFILACLIGFILFTNRIYKHKRWLNKLSKNPQTKFIRKHGKVPVYTSSLITNALLVGYKKPTIWINPQLVNSNYLDIIIEHEMTHIKHKDNYWLVLIELINAVYWWNPLLKILASNLKDYIEARCDHKTSHHFTEGIYQQKLTDLILLYMPVSNAGFVSAVISKNSNIRRLKSLKEKQNMNLFSKVFISLLLTSSVVILTFPVSAFKSLADSEQAAIHSDEELVNLKFDSISIENIAEITADFFHLETVVSEELKTKLVSVYLKDVPENKLLEALTDIINVKFEILDNQLQVSPLQQIVNPSDRGVLISLKIEASDPINESIHTTKIESRIWSHFDAPASVKINDNWELEITAKENTSNLAMVLLDAKIYLLTPSGDRELLATPRVFTTNGNLATIETGEAGKNFSFRAEILPQKMRYSEVNSKVAAQTE